MVVIKNKLIPFKGFLAINLFGIVFVRSEIFNKFTDKIKNHEAIHSKQMIEMLFVFFYLWYLIEWIIRLIQYKDSKVAYKNISFEAEAFKNEANLDYLKDRKLYAWTKFL
jgi:hypothetical protein